MAAGSLAESTGVRSAPWMRADTAGGSADVLLREASTLSCRPRAWCGDGNTRFRMRSAILKTSVGAYRGSRAEYATWREILPPTISPLVCLPACTGGGPKQNPKPATELWRLRHHRRLRPRGLDGASSLAGRGVASQVPVRAGRARRAVQWNGAASVVVNFHGRVPSPPRGRGRRSEPRVSPTVDGVEVHMRYTLFLLTVTLAHANRPRWQRAQLTRG